VLSLQTPVPLKIEATKGKRGNAARCLGGFSLAARGRWERR
jgi:hypothetical protein